jgi:hypothetical protein
MNARLSNNDGKRLGGARTRIILTTFLVSFELGLRELVVLLAKILSGKLHTLLL